MYESATAVPELSPPPTPPCKRTRADWERDAREKKEEAENMRILRDKDIPAYFNSELGKSFLLSQVRVGSRSVNIGVLCLTINNGILANNFML